MQDDRIVYVIFYPACHPKHFGQPCYVGKGKVNRLREHVKGSHNPQLKSIFKSANDDLPMIIVREGLSNIEAFEIEVLLISIIGRADQGTGTLVNHTNGGEGVVGYKWTPEQCYAASIARKGKCFLTEVSKKLISEKLSGVPKTLEHNAAVSAAKRGKPLSSNTYEGQKKRRLENPWKTFSPAGMHWWCTVDGKAYQAIEPRSLDDNPGRGTTIGLVISKALTGKRLSLSHRAAISLAQQNLPSDIKVNKSEKLRIAHIGRKHSPEAVEASRIAHIGLKYKPRVRVDV